MSATGHEDHYHMIAGLKIAHAFAQCLDDARRFVPERHRHRAGPVAVDDGKIGVAKACGTDADEDFAGAGRGKLDLFDRKRPAGGVRARHIHLSQYRGFDLHSFSLHLKSFIHAIFPRH